MEVGAIPSVNGITDNSVASGEVSEETFLQLLSTQLQHQDPLEPADDVEFIQQMATFASLEQQRITNQNLSVMQLYDSSINNSNALNIVGKEVKVTDSLLSHEQGQTHNFSYDSDSPAEKIHVTIYDSDGKKVFNQTQTGVADGEQDFIWNGTDTNGNALPPGEYHVEVNLEDSKGNRFPSHVYQRKYVEGVSYENGSILVIIDGAHVPIQNVVEVYEPPAQPPTQQQESNPFTQAGLGFKQAYMGGGRNTPAYIPANQHNYNHPFRVIPGGR